MLALSFFAVESNSQELRGSIEVQAIDEEKFSVELGLDTRFEYDNGFSHKTNLGSIGLSYRVFKNLQFKTAYRQALDLQRITNQEVSNNSCMDDKSRLTIDLIHKTKRVENYRIKNKFRYQLSDISEDESETYLRYKLIVDYKFSQYFKPFYGGELIYKPEKSKLKSFRIYLGNEQEIMDRNVEGYFIIENEFKKTSIINFNYILGINIKL